MSFINGCGTTFKCDKSIGCDEKQTVHCLHHLQLVALELKDRSRLLWTPENAEHLKIGKTSD